MAKHSKLSPLDQAIQKWAAVFNGIEGYDSEDEDIRYAGTFIATKIFNLEQTRSLTINSFVPAINKAIADTKQQLSTSIYKQFIKSVVEDNLQVVKEDSIRLGYVMFFHKYENFVKDYVLFIEMRSESDTIETNQTLLEFCKDRFGFSPLTWWKYPVIHKVNFISNCTKHHDGKCRLDNKKHTKPSIYSSMSEDDVIKPTIEQFKADTFNVIQATANHFVPIFENIAMVRSSENLLASYQSMIETYVQTIKIYEESKMINLALGLDIKIDEEEINRCNLAIQMHRLSEQECRERLTVYTQNVRLNISSLEAEIT